MSGYLLARMEAHRTSALQWPPKRARLSGLTLGRAKALFSSFSSQTPFSSSQDKTFFHMNSSRWFYCIEPTRADVRRGIFQGTLQGPRALKGPVALGRAI